MYRNLRISKKILLGFGVVILAATIMLGLAVMSLVNIGGLSHKLFSGPYVATTEAMGIRRDINLLGKDIRSAALEKNVQKYEKSLEETAALANSRLDKLRQSFQGDDRFITELEGAMKALSQQRMEVIALMEAGDWQKATDLIFSDYLAAYEVCAEKSDALYNDADARGAAFDASSSQSVTMSTIFLLGIFAVMLAISLAVSIITTKAITRPLTEIEGVAKRISQGTIKNEIHYRSKDEAGALADSFRATCDGLSAIITDISNLLKEISQGNFNAKARDEAIYVGEFKPIFLSLRSMAIGLSETMGQINQAAEQVSSGAEQVSSGAQALSQGATEQASSVEELAATINEISEQIKSNASNAMQASTNANSVGDEMIESNGKMQGMIKAMAEISSSSSQIGKIIKTIEDIAFQTNILALNAAVEAARAGAAGKGFAVVADEVRNLASKSAEASKNTAALIESSIKAVDNGTKIAGETARAMLSAVDGAKQVAEIVDRISGASNDQASSVVQVTQGIEQISSVVQTNSATAEESAAASEELSSQALMLKTSVSKFELWDTGNSPMAFQPQGSSFEEPAYHSGSSKY